jgi:hypothetical protein
MQVLDSFTRVDRRHGVSRDAADAWGTIQGRRVKRVL